MERKIFKILMMGGRRAGKSTILSSILTQLSDNTPGEICVINDNTDYTQTIQTMSGEVNLPTLNIKQNELKNYLLKRRKNTEFLVDMSPTNGKSSYILEVSANHSSIYLEFIDVPGEWMRENSPEYNTLTSLVKECDVFVIAIDTPFIMNSNDVLGVNNVYNRINEITKALRPLTDVDNNDKKNILDLKRIILCPIKCEKWIRNGQADLVVERVKKVYRNLINRSVDYDNVSIQIMPIQTVGGIEFTNFLPAMLYFDDEDNGGVGSSCSVHPLTGQIMFGDGRIMYPKDGTRVESDRNWEIDKLEIPLSWYKLNEEGYAPNFCEQPGYHILKFLVNKEENVIKYTAMEDKKKLNDFNFIKKLYYDLFKPTFGEYLPVWQDVINKLDEQFLIKNYGDGFCFVKEKV